MGRALKHSLHHQKKHTELRIGTCTSLENFAWLVSLVRRLRPDLCKLFPMKKLNHSVNFMAWLMTSGTGEYAALREDRDFLNILSQRVPGLGLTPLQALVYFQRKDVQKVYPLPEYSEEVVRWFYQHGVHEHHLEWAIPFEILSSERDKRQTANAVQQYSTHQFNREFGVNLIGYAYGQLGIGEDVRMTAKCLLAAGIPFTILNFPPGNDIPQNDFSMAEHVSEDGKYAINIFCLTALETGRYYAEKGKSQFKGRYNIGYWPWELSKWPEEWMDLFRLVDEVWASSRHIYDAVAPVSPVPVLIMPLAVELGPISDMGRVDFGLPLAAYLFCFSFDLNSSIHRKNPQACVRAFLQAFPRGEPNAKTKEEVGLVIKVHKPSQFHSEWEKLKRIAAEDDRIHIIEGTLSRANLLALYKCCNCFLSLHRAEGFGRGIAEAILLGLQVITTGYSGNVDFCADNPHVELVDYDLVPVSKLEYPFGNGQIWANADYMDAALLMHKCINIKNTNMVEHLESFNSRVNNLYYKNRIDIINNVMLYAKENFLCR